MKKKIVSIISALVLTCAMSLNVAAAGSVTAADVAEAAGDVAVPTVEKSVEVAEEIVVSEGVTVSQLDNADAKVLAEEVAKLNNADAVTGVTVFAMVDLDSTSGRVEVKMALNGNEAAYALHYTEKGVEKIVGENIGDGKVAFEFGSFSPVAIMKVAFKSGNPSPAPATGSTTTETAAAATAAVAPKTGDVSMMVTVMAVIFMAGAAVAVFMSKKRA